MPEGSDEWAVHFVESSLVRTCTEVIGKIGKADDVVGFFFFSGCLGFRLKFLEGGLEYFHR